MKRIFTLITAVLMCAGLYAEAFNLTIGKAPSLYYNAEDDTLGIHFYAEEGYNIDLLLWFAHCSEPEYDKTYTRSDEESYSLSGYVVNRSTGEEVFLDAISFKRYKDMYWRQNYEGTLTDENGNTYNFAYHGLYDATGWLKDGDEWDVITRTLTVNSNPGETAYMERIGIEHVIISDAVTNVGWSAFDQCINMVSLSIGKNVENIEKYAFVKCTSMTSMTCEAVNPPTLGENALKDCSAIEHIYVPAGSVDAYKIADGWSDYASFIEAITETQPQGNTVTWDQEFCRGVNASCTRYGEAYHDANSKDGITCTYVGTMPWNGLAGGELYFTGADSKLTFSHETRKIAKIEVYGSISSSSATEYSGWVWDATDSKLVWEGTPATTVDIQGQESGNLSVYGISQIVFTLEGGEGELTSGVQAEKITNAIYGDWDTSDYTNHVSAADLPGFQEITLEQAKTWVSPTPYACLIYSIDNGVIKYVYVDEDGKYVGETQESSSSTYSGLYMMIYEGNVFYYSTGYTGEGDPTTETCTLIFAANDMTKEVTVTLPYTFECSEYGGDGEMNSIIQELYGAQYGGFSGGMWGQAPTASGNSAVTAGIKDESIHYISISEAFEGTAVVTGLYYMYTDSDKEYSEQFTYTITISIKGDDPTAIGNVQSDKVQGKKVQKVFRNGQLLIIHDGKAHFINGVEAK